MKVTIKKIAEIAGVHPATVDKVLHNRPGVSDEVRERVQKLIDELGYKPNPAGRVLQQQGKEFIIAAIYGGEINLFRMCFIWGVVLSIAAIVLFYKSVSKNPEKLFLCLILVRYRIFYL